MTKETKAIKPKSKKTVQKELKNKDLYKEVKKEEQKKIKEEQKKAASKPMGAPTKYSEEVANMICKNIAMGKSIKKISDENPTLFCMASVFNWMTTYPDFLENYTRAKDEQAEFFAEQIIDIADDGINDTYIDEATGQRRTDAEVIARSRLRVETRKWAISKLKPKKYGDRVENYHSGGTTTKVIYDDIK
jgi:hypothetical protein